MAITVKDMMAAANAAVAKISIDDAKAMIEDDDALLVDVRDANEVEKTGKIAGAHHVSRGMLEFRADDGSPFHHPDFRKDRPVILYCASGARSVLSGKVLKDMGYDKVFNLGAFKDWAAAGEAVESPVDPGM